MEMCHHYGIYPTQLSHLGEFSCFVSPPWMTPFFGPFHNFYRLESNCFGVFLFSCHNTGFKNWSLDSSWIFVSGFRTRNSNWKKVYFFLQRLGVLVSGATRAIWDPLPTIEDLSCFDMESLTLIHLEHQVGDTTYISKNTTELLLHAVGVSLVERRYPYPVVIILIPFLQKEILHALFIMWSLTYWMTQKKSKKSSDAP